MNDFDKDLAEFDAWIAAEFAHREPTEEEIRADLAEDIRWAESEIPNLPPTRGNISRAFRVFCHGRKGRRAALKGARRRARRGHKVALKTGDARNLPNPYTDWDIC